ncbi:hypothetical protein EI94DRAFT_1734089 [Lactarius quietus]|nr:hypothetical protein EI94DRAFT_1734089 [Lactarius quietus]
MSYELQLERVQSSSCEHHPLLSAHVSHEYTGESPRIFTALLRERSIEGALPYTCYPLGYDMRLMKLRIRGHRRR